LAEWSDFDIKYIHSFWDIFELFPISCLDRSISTIQDLIAYGDVFPSEYVSLLSICEIEQCNPARSVWIIFHRSDFGRDISLVISFEIDDSIEFFVTIPHKSGSDPSRIIPSS